MTDLSTTIEAKSDQLNADDLTGSPRTVKITDVRASSGDDQPITIHYEGDNGKPYKPCKSMRRVLVYCWGKNGDDYKGKSMTLFNDETVTWAGQAVGGIRISHMSHIDKDMSVVITKTRGKKAPWSIKKLEVKQVDAGLYDKAMTQGDEVAAKGMDAYKEWFQSVDQASFTPEQRKLFAECHAKWKEIATKEENKDEEVKSEEQDVCPV